MKTVRLAAVLLSFAIASTVASKSLWAQAAAAPAAAEVGIRGKVDAVTVYRGQALVTRTVPLPAGAGMAEVVVTELPDRLVANSLFAEGSPGLEIRSVRYRERPVAQDVREEVRRLDDQIRDVNDKLAANAKMQQLLGEQRAYLDKLATFTAPTANTELTKGVLNADQLKTLTTYQFDQRKLIADQELKLSIEQRTLQEQAQLLARQRGEVAGRATRTLREAVVFINREQAGGNLRLRYLVEGATWSPSYNVRADAEKKAATLEYQAAIQQQSGEDWADVAMTLSTATPNLVAAAPSLNPLTIALSLPVAGSPGTNPGSLPTYATVRDNFAGVQRAAEGIRNQSGGNGIFQLREEEARAQFVNNDRALNRVADQLQVLELITRDGKSEPGRASSAEAIVVTYQMRSRNSLPSRSDRQLVQIEDLALQSKFYKVAVPVLTSYVYDEAELTNNSSIVLLAGPVASYVGGQFVGSGTIDTVSTGQPFTVGFGIDASLRATREREEKTEQTQGGNRIVNFTYKLAVENFGTRPANVRLMDRLPVGKESEVRVTFDDATQVQVSKDAEYLQSLRKKGILRWDLEVPAQRTGSQSVALTYKLHLEHDRNLAISTIGLQGPEIEALLRQ